ncbi:MAG: hypothetical protein B6D71_13930, partial [gamma proteobacterium symbiont of Stewartia floridana]
TTAQRKKRTPDEVRFMTIQLWDSSGVKALFLYFLKADQKFHFITLSRSPKKALTPLFEVVEKL